MHHTIRHEQAWADGQWRIVQRGRRRRKALVGHNPTFADVCYADARLVDSHGCGSRREDG
jgi:hypothetical protein